MLAPLLTSPRTENSTISWSLSPRPPPTTTSPTSPSQLVNSRASKAPPLVGSLTSCIRKLSSTHSRNVLGFFLSAALYFQQVSGKLKSPMRTTASDWEPSASLLQKTSSAASSWLGGLKQTPHHDVRLSCFPPHVYPQAFNLVITIVELYTIKAVPNIQCHPIAYLSLPIPFEEFIPIHCSTPVMGVIQSCFCDQVIAVLMYNGFKLLLFIVRATCIGVDAIELGINMPN